MSMLITDLRHFLDSRSEIPTTLPGPALNLALYLGSIVSWVTRSQPATPERTNVPCRKRPGGRRCPGEVVAAIFADGAEIEWVCPACRERGVISGWQGTRWDRSAGRQ